MRHRRAELGVPGGSKGSLKQRALDGADGSSRLFACARFTLRFDHGTQSMMLLFGAAPPPICDTPRERDLASARGGGGKEGNGCAGLICHW